MIQSIPTGRIYTGISKDPRRRLEKHNTGRGAKATRAGRPWKLRYMELLESKSQALRRELEVKKLSRAKKLELLEG